VLRRRKSTFIHGIEDDARDVIDHLAQFLAKDGGSASDPGQRRRHQNRPLPTRG
jgi:hypothetical protein